MSHGEAGSIPELYQHLTCDWPANGTTACGKAASWFLDEGGVHRPICDVCRANATLRTTCAWIGHVDLSRVPGWPRIKARLDTEKTAKPLTEIKAVDAAPDPNEVRSRVVNPRAYVYGPVDSAPTGPGTTQTNEMPAPSMPSRPPLKDALAELAVSMLQLAKVKVDEWGKR